MPSQIMQIMTSSINPMDALKAIYDDVIHAERAISLSDGAKTAFFKEVEDRGRGWGEACNDEFKVEVEDDGFDLHFEGDRYRRCCYVGKEYDRLFIPDALVMLYENDDEYQEYTKAVAAFVKERADKLETAALAEADRAREREIRQTIEDEMHERQELARLQSKYGAK